MTLQKLLILLALHFSMTVFTYGHAYREAVKTDQENCEHSQNPRLCWDSSDPGMEAWFESLFWPYHWSAYIWSKT